MISKETFCSKLEEKVRELNPEALIDIHDVEKVNVVKTCISCRIGENNPIAKSIYYENYMDTEETRLDELVSELAGLLLKDDTEGNEYVQKIMKIMDDRDKFLAHAKVCLLNEKQNVSLAYCEKSEKFEGLVEAYYIGYGECSVWITQKMLDSLGIEKEELRQAALENSFSTTRICGMMDIIGGLMGLEDIPDEVKEDLSELRKDPTDMYVVSNTTGFRGAICAENIEKLAEYLEDDLYILPSSIHEMIALPAQLVDMRPVDSLLDMVREVNSGQVAPDERLIDAVYEYNRENKSFRKVA